MTIYLPFDSWIDLIFFRIVYTLQVNISKQIQSKETPIFDQGFANIYVTFRERG